MEIKIYSTPTCSKCKQLISAMKQKKMKFGEFSLDEPKHMEAIRNYNVTEAPVILIDNQLVGFDYFISHYLNG